MSIYIYMYYNKLTTVRQLSSQQVKEQANYTISRDKSDKDSKILMIQLRTEENEKE